MVLQIHQIDQRHQIQLVLEQDRGVTVGEAEVTIVGVELGSKTLVLWK